MGNSQSSYYTIYWWIEYLSKEVESITQNLEDLSKKIDRGAKIEDGNLSMEVQALSSKVNDNTDAEDHRLNSAVAALAAQIDDKLNAETGLLTADIIAHSTALDNKVQALSTKVDSGLQGTSSAINKGLAIGPSIGLGIPLILALSIISVLLYKGRRYRRYMLQSLSNALTYSF
ncbi:uncharacterized protein N7529_007165 [Penicillium soppii]|jgi:hypothetical protein|uniref:uncharacterized protein n=1 Tax=Penicillium soppii TaxID=69789 RepID=UPI002549360F|nr:uncharacterized protein N7529_007165 [Penicillium soppii]KAJ5865249.1 hypothetical protein N7529_007165 [Penicillium soppii]